MSNDQRSEYIRLSRVQDVYGVHRATIYRWAAKGVVTIYKLDGISLLRRSEMESMIRPASAGA
ncbi:hypothetical protein JJJ17_02650 [Paracoccus caeni]|uniref:Helix-turn-helix domain-containing protein n=1 Tax=Paracoccus caeni TaxID=657651 RepID=A0A934S9G2_9RHOB|nr:hypothetical protein [Paracoccus caeni]MBK4214820.1 hypothetical protein [Paracoccus caeni]